MKDTKTILEPDCLYHIYNRANGSEQLFLNEENYRYFMEKFRQYVLPVAEVWAYCLMPNHFHFLVKVRSEGEILELELFQKSKASRIGNLQGFQNLEGLITQQFSNFFNAYSKAFNKQHSRKGSLFMHPYKRIKITSEKYLAKLIHYIHYNPVEAGLTSSPDDWKFSSYPSIISQKPTLVHRDDVIDLFGDIENFKYCHKYSPSMTGIENL